MLKSFFLKLAFTASFVFLISICFAENKTETTAKVIHEQLPVVHVQCFDVKSINKKVSDAECQGFFTGKVRVFDMKSPVLKFNTGVTSVNRFFQEYEVDDNGFVFGHGMAELLLDIRGETVKTKMKYETVRLVGNPENVAVFYNGYCRGFFKSTWVKSGEK